MSSRSPTQAEVLSLALSRALAEVRLVLPAQVERYDPAKQLADVQPLLMEPHEDEEGNRLAEQLPVITNVPVRFPGAGGFALTFPVARGDTGYLVFCHQSLDVWLAKGGIVDPGLDHRFSLADAVFEPGLRPFSAPLADAPTDRACLGAPGGVGVNVDQNEVRLGGNTGVQLVALANLVLDRLTAIVNTFNAHTHATAMGPSGPPTPTASAPAAVASSNVKAKE
jgi:hypothetical protein